MKAMPVSIVPHWARPAASRLRSSLPASGNAVLWAAQASARVAAAATAEMTRNDVRQSPTTSRALMTRGALTAAAWLETPWTPMALPTRSGNSSLTSGFAAMKYVPLDSPIRNAPTVRWGTDCEKAVNPAANTRNVPVARTTWWRGTRVSR